MAHEKKHSLHQNDAAQRTEWAVQRVGWCIWGMVIVAALAGLLGPGPLSSTSALAPDGSAEIRFDRFVHAHHPLTLEVVLPAIEGREAAPLMVSRSLLDAVQIQRMEPEPQRCLITEHGNVYTFPTSGDAAKVLIHLEYQKYGSLEGKIGLADSTLVNINQFVYP